MSTRRSPANIKSGNNSGISSPHSSSAAPVKASLIVNGEALPSSSPSKPKRSVVDSGRLCWLKSRGKPRCWYGIFILGAMMMGTTVGIINILHQQDPTFNLVDSSFQQRLRMTYDNEGSRSIDSKNNNNFDGDRVFFQDISSLQLNPSKWSKLTGTMLYQRAQYQPKPLMMGFLLMNPTKQSLATNYNTNKHQSDQLSKTNMSPGKPATHHEQFEVARIHPQDHGIVEIVSAAKTKHPSFKKENPALIKEETPHWTFTNVLVEELGNGVSTQKDINNDSKEYNRFKPDFTPEECVPQYDWQILSYPNCNTLHELDYLTKLQTLNPAEEPESMLLARGGYRDVWMVENNDLPSDITGEVVAMKTLLYEHPFSERNTDRHRRDALATDRLTGSPYALNLYAYCSNTGLYDFAEGGSLEDAVENEKEWQKWTAATKMKYAYQVAQAMADVHNIDHEGLPSMSHTDISMSQFVSKDGGETYQINDFNRARFIFRKKDNPEELCKFEVASNKGKFRSPEEYAYKPETAAIDNYSMGNIFYVLLTGTYPFDDVKKIVAQEKVQQGHRPEIAEQFLNDKDPVNQALIAAIKKLWIQNPEKRATSREIQQYLEPFATGLTDRDRGRYLSVDNSL